MTFPIEIKLNIEDEVDEAIVALTKSAQPVIRRIWVARDPDQPKIASNESAARVIVRFRSGDDGDDSTVKVRPCRTSRLQGRWSDSFKAHDFEYRIEGDWSRSRRVTAASAVTEFGPNALAHQMSAGDVVGAVSDLQRDFARPFMRSGAMVDRRDVLGPIASIKWSDVPLNGHTVNVEHWAAAGLAFLELSARLKPHDGESEDDFAQRAGKRQVKFEEAVRDRGLRVSTNTDNKTNRMMEALAASHHA